MIEGRGWRDAFRRSSELVRGSTGRVLGLVFVANVATALISVAVAALFGFIPGFVGTWIGSTLAGAFAVPFEAHVLTVLYYRLTEPDVPILRESQPASWQSIWDEDKRE
jgi:hypothetical protein